MKINKLLDIVFGSSIFTKPNTIGHTSIPRNNNKHIKTSKEYKKCKSCKKFNTNECYYKYITPLTTACKEYIPKKR